MKKILFFLTMLTIVCCHKTNMVMDVNGANGIVQIEKNNYKVSPQEALTLAGKFSKKPTKANNDLHLTPILDEFDTTGYVVNMPNEEGWYIISGDKRVPAVLAMSDTGHFDLESAKNCPGLNIWLECATHPFVLDSTLAKQWGEGEVNLPRTKGGEDPHMNDWLQEVYVDVIPEVYMVTDPFIKTQWKQGNPWNLCTPKTSGGGRCPTGCVATAVAQMMYYLATDGEVHLSSYSYGVCEDYAGNGTLYPGDYTIVVPAKPLTH